MGVLSVFAYTIPYLSSNNIRPLPYSLRVPAQEKIIYSQRTEACKGERRDLSFDLSAFPVFFSVLSAVKNLISLSVVPNFLSQADRALCHFYIRAAALITYADNGDKLLYLPVCRLSFNHPTGVFLWQGAYFIYFFQVISR